MLISFLNDVDKQLILEFSFGKYHPVSPKNPIFLLFWDMLYESLILWILPSYHILVG